MKRLTSPAHLKSQTGFGLVFELVLAAAVLLVIGFALLGFIYFKAQKPKTATAQPTPSQIAPTTPMPISGWLTYESKYDGLTFRYPSDWMLNTTQNSDARYQNDEITTLTSKTGFVITLNTHVLVAPTECDPAHCADIQTVERESLARFANGYYLAQEYRDPATQKVLSRKIGLKAVADPGNPYDQIPAIGTVHTFKTYLTYKSRGIDNTLASFSGSYPDDTGYYKLSTADFFKLPDVATAKLILKSAVY